MLEILAQSTPTCLVVRFSGKVTGEGYRQFVEAAVERLSAGDRVSLVLELTDFDFYGDLDAGWQDFKFGVGEYRQFYRAALVGDRKWIAWFVRLIGPFTHAEEKRFSADKMNEALEWANT